MVLTASNVEDAAIIFVYMCVQIQANFAKSNGPSSWVPPICFWHFGPRETHDKFKRFHPLASNYLRNVGIKISWSYPFGCWRQSYPENSLHCVMYTILHESSCCFIQQQNRSFVNDVLFTFMYVRRFWWCVTKICQEVLQTIGSSNKTGSLGEQQQSETWFLEPIRGTDMQS